MNSWSKIWSSVGRAEGSLLSSLQIRLRAAGETVLGMENLLAVMRIYVSFSVDVSKGGLPTSNAYLKIKEFLFFIINSLKNLETFSNPLLFREER